MLNRLDLRGRGGDVRSLLPRPGAGGDEPLDAVKSILQDVRERGDRAVRDYSLRFDGVELGEMRLSSDAIEGSLQKLPRELVDALIASRDSIRAFHESQRQHPETFERDGILVEGRLIPVDRAGIYVPGGRGAYPSTVLMTAVPARVAGVQEVVLCVPPDKATGQVAPSVLAAAALSGVDEVYAIGGAQAIGAMAFGTESVRPVDVIVGPGNIYVALAKREVAGIVGIPTAFAGPSEIVVVADATAPAELVAIDVIVQAEHGPGGLAWLVTWESDVADAVDAAVGSLVATSPRRAEIESTFRDGGYVVLVDGPDQAIEVSNAIAPEHLELMVADPDALVPLVRHAGAVFCGVLSPASIGDYIAGPSHVLPTYGSARFAGALTISDFCKQVHVISVSAEGFDRAANHVAVLAAAEGFDAHAQSILLRQLALDRGAIDRGPS